jgi:hypothetical protein
MAWATLSLRGRLAEAISLVMSRQLLVTTGIASARLPNKKLPVMAGLDRAICASSIVQRSRRMRHRAWMGGSSPPMTGKAGAAAPFHPGRVGPPADGNSL